MATDSAEVVISVDDEGMGIAPEDLERIFHRCERVETGEARRTVGIGIAIADLHHGRVWETSEPGVGSTFSLARPVSALGARQRPSAQLLSRANPAGGAGSEG